MADPGSPHIAAATQNGVENIEKIDFSGTDAPRPVGGKPPKSNVQTNT